MLASDYEVPRIGRNGKALPNYNEATMDWNLSETDDEYAGSMQPEDSEYSFHLR